MFDLAGEDLNARLSSRRGPLLLGPSPIAAVHDDASRAAATEALMGALRGSGPSKASMASMESMESMESLQRRIADAGADLLLAPTSSTSATALASTGFGYRAAALTGEAVDQTRAASPTHRKTWVIGDLEAPTDRAEADESRRHLDRVATAGADGVVLRGADRASLSAFAATAKTMHLATLIQVNLTEADDVVAHVDAIEAAMAGAGNAPAQVVVLVRTPYLRAMFDALDRLAMTARSVALGVVWVAPSDSPVPRDGGDPATMLAREGRSRQLAVVGIEGRNAIEWLARIRDVATSR